MNESHCRIALALYVGAFFWAVGFGDVVVNREAYKLLTLNPPNTVSMLSSNLLSAFSCTGGTVRALSAVDLPPPLGTGKASCVLLKYGQGSFSSAPLGWTVWTVPLAAIVVAMAVWVILRIFRPTLLRGILMTLTVLPAAVVVSSVDNNLRGLGSYPSTPVVLIIALGCGLFWWLDVFVNPGTFDKQLAAVGDDMDRIQLIYDHTKMLIKFAGGIWTATGITLAWSISSSLKAEYGATGLADLFAKWMIWLVFWGSLGLLGGIGGELGRRFGCIFDHLGRIHKEAGEAAPAKRPTSESRYDKEGDLAESETPLS